MTRKGTPPVVSFKTGNPTHPPDVANKNYVDNIIPIVPVPPVYTAYGSFEKDVMIQGYIPTGVNTTFRFSPLGGLLYKQGDVGNEFPQTPIRSVIEFRSFRVFLNSLSQNETIIEITFYKDDAEYVKYEVTIPALSRQSNIISVGPGHIHYSIGDWAYATIGISGAIAANFCTITMAASVNVQVTIRDPTVKDTAMQVKDTAKQELPAIQQIKRKTISQRLLSIFR